MGSVFLVLTTIYIREPGVSFRKRVSSSPRRFLRRCSAKIMEIVGSEQKNFAQVSITGWSIIVCCGRDQLLCDKLNAWYPAMTEHGT